MNRDTLRVVAAKVLLKDIVGALERVSDDFSNYLDQDTGTVLTISNEVLGMAEEGEPPGDLADEHEEYETAVRIVTSGRYLELPSKWEVSEQDMMEDFTATLDSEKARAELAAPPRGPGAMRRFKDILRRHGLERSWQQFRTEALRDMAVEWCEQNGVAYRE